MNHERTLEGCDKDNISTPLANPESDELWVISLFVH